MINLVSIVVLKIQDVTGITRPGIPFNGAMILSRYLACITAVERTDPNVGNTIFIRGEPRQSITIRRNLGIGALGWSKQDLPWNKRGRVGVGDRSPRDGQYYPKGSNRVKHLKSFNAQRPTFNVQHSTNSIWSFGSCGACKSGGSPPHSKTQARNEHGV
jgi:hypothetical protein